MNSDQVILCVVLIFLTIGLWGSFQSMKTKDNKIEEMQTNIDILQMQLNTATNRLSNLNGQILQEAIYSADSVIVEIGNHYRTHSVDGPDHIDSYAFGRWSCHFDLNTAEHKALIEAGCNRFIFVNGSMKGCYQHIPKVMMKKEPGHHAPVYNNRGEIVIDGYE